MSFLTPPRDGQKTPFVTRAYFRQRQRDRLFDLVHAEFRKSGLTQAELARRMGRRPEVVSRMLGAPGNWRLDTVSDLLFAISGAEAAFTTRYPMAESASDAAAPADAVATPAAPSPAPTARDGRTKG
ncbi:MAG: hypothetical protein VX596_02360 [Pseudomonadota bacterium]|nr:hypothetical protein [Pseudomonadota bacterium]